MRVLEAQGRMTEAGRQAYARRSEMKPRIYSYEQEGEAQLSAEDELEFRNHKSAWGFFEAQPAWYRHLVAHRIASAKKLETKARRLARHIEASAKGERV
jgi:uncharacterized protein YdeI (YjbR/CyaY-like superfamily)